MVGVERAVVVAHAGVVTADDQVRAAVVLAEQGVQQRLAGAGVTHVQRVAGLHHGVLHEVVLDQGADRFLAHFRRNITGLQVAQQRVHHHAVADFDGDLGQVLVGAVHRVAGLEGGDAFPAALFEHGAGFGGCHVDARVLLREVALAEHLHRAGQVDVALGEHHFHARMLFVGGLEHLLTLVRLVDGVLLVHQHGAHDVAVTVDQRDFLAFGQTVGGGLVGGQGDRDRPEHAVGQRHVVAHTLPVGFPHEAVQRRETADAEHDQIAALAGTEGDFRQRTGRGQRAFPFGAFQQPDVQRFAAVGFHQLRHVHSLDGRLCL